MKPGGEQHHRPELAVECPACGAEAGRRCLTRTGKKRTETHRERDQKARDELPNFEQLDREHCAWLGIPYDGGF